MKRQSGFTLIELIIVIVILGILAVTAAPQFFNFGSDARQSTVRGLEGSINGTADLVYARSAIGGIENQGVDDGSYATNRDEIQVVFGYPAASTAGLIAALNISEGDWDIVIDGTPGSASVRFSPVGFNELNDDTAPTYAEIANCSVTYSESTAAGARPEVDVETSC
ncbi:MAG: prepilin-type N-terminal cleavage/methylation domain-containing protein [Idiomarina sp.]|nr:prepilin-type N-terminal cleavage/methylation domain-containing protein [Idiomarina sp.]